MGKPYRNDSAEVLESRNPRYAIKPGETVVLDLETINHALRSWIRSGVLVLDEDAIAAEAAKKKSAAKPAAKAPAKKPVAKKPVAKKPAAKAKT